MWGFTETANLISSNITWIDLNIEHLDPLNVWQYEMPSPPPRLLLYAVWTVSVMSMNWGRVGSNAKMLKLLFFPTSVTFMSPLSLSLCSSGYSLLHVTREDTWKWIQLQIWHLVARMPALRGKPWRCVLPLSSCRRLAERHENALVQLNISKTKSEQIQIQTVCVASHIPLLWPVIGVNWQIRLLCFEWCA